MFSANDKVLPTLIAWIDWVLLRCDVARRPLCA